MNFQKLFFHTKFGRSSTLFTKEQATEFLNEKGCIITHTRRCNDKVVYFFSDNHLFGYSDERNKIDFVPCTSSGFPMEVTPRPGLENGLITNIDEYIAVFHSNDTFLATEEELHEYLDKNPDAYVLS